MKKLIMLLVIAAVMLMGAKSTNTQNVYLDDAFGEVGGSSPVAT